jgi:phospholipid/cholesterol/gamma-HCH transport system permease protein
MSLLEQLGQKTTRRVADMMYALGFFALTMREAGRYLLRRQPRRVLLMQILFTGVEALPVVGILSLALGAIIIIQGISLLPQFGRGELIYTILIATITRELGPILTGFIVTSRSGTAITTELGNMVVNHEVEAYIATGIDPLEYLVVPRVIGVTVSIVLLNLYFNAFGLLGSYFVTALIRSIGFREYFGNLLNALTVVDVAISLIKSVVFGAIISVTATYFGFRVEEATTEVPVMAIKSVGRGFVLLILANAILTLAYYLMS